MPRGHYQDAQLQCLTDFLKALSPPQGQLLNRLVDAGLCDDGYFATIIQDAVIRDKVFNDLVTNNTITLVQRSILLAGLQRLR